MGKLVEIDYESKNDRRSKRIFEKCLCVMCGELLNKKEEKNGICWECFDDEFRGKDKQS